jgi:PhnB protein
MQVSPYLSFNGNCERAFTFYEQHLGARKGALFHYAGSPMADQVPGEWQDKVMHGSVTIGGQMLMGADEPPGRYEQPKGFTLALNMSDTADAERIFHALSQDGRIVMPLEKTFWAARFGMVVDPFGIPWTVNCEEASSPAGS